MKEWSKNLNQSEDFETLIKPVILLYKKVMKSPNKHHKYNGFNIGSREKACCPNANEYGSPELIKYNHERGRDIHDMFLQLAFQLGVEQGRRLERSNN